jgi:hypothetical protein
MTPIHKAVGDFSHWSQFAIAAQTMIFGVYRQLGRDRSAAQNQLWEK